MKTNFSHKVASVLALVVALTATQVVSAEGSADAGKAKSMTCAGCHGVDGNSVNPEWPSLAGQHASYIARQLAAFKDGSRNNPLMSAQAMMLGDQDMQDLGAYFAAQTPATKTVADAATVDRGRALYLGGDAEKGVTACLACHGPTGAGNAPAGFPAIAGQHAVYAAQLRAYAKGERKTDAPAKMMRDIASRLSEEDIKAVASYVQGLH
jgi:cytochrome c553